VISIIALWYGKKDLVEFPVKQGADIQSRDKHGRLPLHRAVLQGHLNAAVYLIDEGTDIEPKTSLARNPYRWP
jgi:ankyrin repeat protein